MLITVSKTVLVSVCTPLVAIRFGTSSQLGSSNLLFSHGGGGAVLAGSGRDRGLLSRKPAAPPWRQNRSL